MNVWNFPYLSSPFSTFWLILEGERIIEVNGTRHHAKRGDLFHIPSNLRFRTFHQDDKIQPFVYLALGAKVTLGGFDWNQLYQPLTCYRFDDSAEFGTLHQQWRELWGLWKIFWEDTPSTHWEMSIKWLEIQEKLHGWLSFILDFIKPPSSEIGRNMDERVFKVNEYMLKNLHKKIKLQDLSQIAHTSDGHLRHLFHHSLCISPMKHLMNLRLQKSKELLKMTRLAITEISAETGFDDIYHFSKMFRRHEQISPSEYRSLNWMEFADS